MYMSHLSLRNFRQFGDSADKLDLPLSSGVTALVGRNDSGKTSVIDAIRYAPPSSLYTDRPRVSINSGAFAETLRYCALRTLDPSSNRRSGGVWDAF